MPVDDYFQHRAPAYITASENWPWSSLRAVESEAFFSLVGIIDGLDVLELGCGAGFYTSKLVKFGARRIWAVDRSDAMLAQLPEGPIESILADATNLQINRRFPLILSAGLLEFLPSPDMIFKIAAAHSESDGRFVVLVPGACTTGRVYAWFHRRHELNIQLFELADLKKMASAAGWEFDSFIRCGLFSIVASFKKT
jgi:trans-aconitate methyltransferase